MQAFGLARVGRDVELRSTPSGEQVANVSLAFNYGRKGEDGKRPTQWVDGVLWSKRAEALAQYLIKGQMVSVTLEDVHIETYQARDGTPGSKMVGKIAQIELAGRPDNAGREPAAAPPPPPARRAAPAPQKSNTGFDDMNDDIPFVLSLNDYSILSSKDRRLNRSSF